MHGHGLQPIPSPFQGSIESVVWQHTLHLRALGHHVSLVNVRPRKVLKEMWRVHEKEGPFDWVITHHERMVAPLAKYAKATGARLAACTHMPVTGYQLLDKFSQGRMRMVARAPYHLCLTPDALLTIRTLNRDARAAILPNGVDPGQFAFSPEPGNGRAICIGLLCERKRQAEVAAACSTHPIDFVGPIDEEHAPSVALSQSPRYAGEWSREEVYRRMTDYSALVLWSSSEGQPLVIMEAFAAGLSVVVSPEASRNLDMTKPWIFKVRSAEEIPAALARAISENARHRAAIRAHVEEDWSWAKVAERLEGRLRHWDAEAGR